VIVFGEWLPDQPALENPGALEALNVFPLTQTSYGAIQALVELGDALTARCQGAFTFRGIDGTVLNTAFDATTAYTWDGDSWEDASRLAGGAYAVATADMVSATQFGDVVIAVNGTDAPQKFTIGSSTNYAALGGSPPVGRFVVTIGEQVQIGRIAGARNRVKHSSFNDAEGWVVGTNGCDQQDLAEGGQIMGMVGGEYGVIFMERAIYRQTFIGSPVPWRIQRMSDNLGCCAENSIATYEQTSCFLDWSGFYKIQGGEAISAIGNQKINDYFWNGERAVNRDFLYRVQGQIDPDGIAYTVCYPSLDSTDGTPDTILVYNLLLDRWSRIEVEVDYLFRFRPELGYNWDNIDTVITNTDATSYLLDSNPFFGSGDEQMAAFTTNFKLATFSGANMEATVDTAEAQVTPGRQTFIREVWPYADGGTLSVKLGTRDLPTAAVTFSDAVAVNSTGFCPFRSRARYHRARVIVAAGGTWTHLQGVTPVGRAEGRY
jgi:hypothetical protein